MSVIDFPTAEEKQRAILMALQNGARMTVQDMLRVGRTTEGRKGVSRLRNKGYPIISYRNPGENFNHYVMGQKL
jgi:hypothetical protein